MWPLLDLQRFTAEKAAIEGLAAFSDWLDLGEWRFKDGYLTLACRVRSEQDWIPVTLRYSKHYPQVPPSVMPENRVTWHQYSGGELCLQYRPDNWMPYFTGVQMLESTRALFLEEKTTLDGPITGYAPSAHQTTRGQRFNLDTDRLVMTPTMMEWIEGMAEVHEARFATLSSNGGQRVVISGMRWRDDQVYFDQTIPSVLRQESLDPNGVILLRDAPPSPLPSDRDALLLALVGSDIADVFTGWTTKFFVAVRYPDAFRAWIFKPNEAKEMAVILPETKQRLPRTHDGLSAKSVGLIGTGSIGSKVAASLARSGLGNILLVDDDIFEADNLVRGELDWTAVGSHKTEALKARLRRLSASIQVTTRNIRLGGQTTGSWTDSTVTALSECDLIIDATADPRVFNFATAAAISGLKPMVWAEVYGGGYGGMVGRARPNKEPTPFVMRDLYAGWCELLGKPAPRAAPGYEQTGDEPWIADDADVSVIAGHLSRYAIDILTRDTSIFPNSLYLVGMREEWNFRAPFHALPMSIPPDADLSWTGPKINFEEPKTKAALMEFLKTLGIDETPDQSDAAV